MSVAGGLAGDDAGRDQSSSREKVSMLPMQSPQHVLMDQMWGELERGQLRVSLRLRTHMQRYLLSWGDWRRSPEGAETNSLSAGQVNCETSVSPTRLEVES